MLAGTNNNALQNFKKVNTEFVFFYQRWQEMLESRTLDMYQYNILNSCVACVELSDVIEKTLSGLLTSRQNVDDAKAEALEIVKTDDVLLKYSKPLRNTLLRVLGSKIDSKPRSEAVDDKNSQFYISLNRIKYQLKTSVRTLRTEYIGYILQELKIDIDTQNYKQIERHMAMVISQCIFTGWSARGLFILSCLFEGDASSDNKWDKFSRKILVQTNNHFEIFYSIKIETRTGISADSVRDVIRSLDLVLEKGDDIIANNQGHPNLCSKIKADTNYLVINLDSPDLYSAVLSAINTLNSKLSIATFYNTINPWIANFPQIVVFDTTNDLVEALSITDVFKTFDYIDSNNNVFDDTNRIFSDPAKMHIANRLNAAFAYTNLSRSSLFQETKYISLWIAIESVMRTGQYSDIISHVKCVLPEVLCIRYFYRIVRNFSEDCMRCGFKYDVPLNVDMRTENKKQLVTDLILIFRDPAKYAVLQTHCVNNELLNYRCNEIHELLNDINAIVQKIDHYTTKVRWHIQCLYRIRNEITHSAFQEDRSLVIYIEHLYTYLAQLMSEVVYYVEHKNIESVEEAFSIILETYNTYYELLKEGNMQLDEILSDGVINIL